MRTQSLQLGPFDTSEITPSLPAPSKAQHSPLPWSEQGGIITAGISPGQPYIADCRFGPLDNREANARLIIESVNNFALLKGNRDYYKNQVERDDALIHRYKETNASLRAHADKLAADLKLAIQVIKECGGYSHTVDELTTTIKAYEAQ